MQEHFGTTKNADVAAHLGVPPRTIIRIARDMGLEKHSDFTKAMQRNAAEHAARTNRASGGNEGMRNLLLYGKAHRFRSGESNRNRMGEEAFREMHRRIGKSRKEIFRKERRRVLFGLEQKTGLRVVRCPREKISLRRNLRRHGYEVARASNEAFVTPRTRRSQAMEERAGKMGMRFTLAQSADTRHTKPDKLRQQYLCLASRT